MAGCFRSTWFSTIRHTRLWPRQSSYSARRYLLTEAYSCHKAWNERLNSQLLKTSTLNEFAVQLRGKLEKDKRASVVDMDILANKLHEMEVADVEFMEYIINKFRRSPEAVPVNESIVYAIVRAYIDLNLTDRLISMMKDKWNYGIFPNDHAVNVLLNHLIVQKNYQEAAQVVYEMMLKEDFSHPLTYLLSLYSCINHYSNISIEAPPSDVEIDPDEEEDWIPVKVIRYPIYDDHFDIKDERYLMGKTLYMLGRTSNNCLLSRSLQFLGLGMYHKFSKALKLLEEWEKAEESSILVKDSMSKFEDCLEKAETKNLDEPEKDLGLRTMDDEIKKVRITSEEKETFTSQLQNLKAKIKDRTSGENLCDIVETLVTSNVSLHEAKDIEKQTELYSIWNKDRESLIQKQIWEYTRTQKEAELKIKLKELQEKEEMLNFFELRDEIIMAKNKAPKIKAVKEEEDEEILIAKRRKRRMYRPAVV